MIARHRAAALLFMALALAMKALVPAGYMVGARAMVLSVEICADTTGEHVTKRIAIPLRDASPSGAQAKPASPCAFTSLLAASFVPAAPAITPSILPPAAPLQLGKAAAITLPSARHLRPFLRGPPTFAAF